MKARQQSLHDEGWQSRARKEGDAQKLDDVRVAEGAHKLTFPHELGRSLGFSQKNVDGFGGGAHRNDNLLHFAIGPAADFGASELDVGENERPQPWMIAEKLFSHFFLGCLIKSPTQNFLPRARTHVRESVIIFGACVRESATPIFRVLCKPTGRHGASSGKKSVVILYRIFLALPERRYK